MSVSSCPFLLWRLLCRFDFTSPSLVIALMLKEFSHSQDCFCCHQAEDFHTCISRTFSRALVPVSFHFPRISGWIFCHLLKLNMSKSWTALFPTKSACPKHHIGPKPWWHPSLLCVYVCVCVCVCGHTHTHIKSIGSQGLWSLLF